MNSSGDERFGSSNGFLNSTPLPNSHSVGNLMTSAQRFHEPNDLPTFFKDSENDTGIDKKLSSFSSADNLIVSGGGIMMSSHFAFTPSSIAATSTSVLDHEDDPQLQG